MIERSRRYPKNVSGRHSWPCARDLSALCLKKTDSKLAKLHKFKKVGQLKVGQLKKWVNSLPRNKLTFAILNRFRPDRVRWGPGIMPDAVREEKELLGHDSAVFVFTIQIWPKSYRQPTLAISFYDPNFLLQNRSIHTSGSNVFCLRFFI